MDVISNGDIERGHNLTAPQSRTLKSYELFARLSRLSLAPLRLFDLHRRLALDRMPICPASFNRVDEVVYALGLQVVPARVAHFGDAVLEEGWDASFHLLDFDAELSGARFECEDFQAERFGHGEGYLWRRCELGGFDA